MDSIKYPSLPVHVAPAPKLFMNQFLTTSAFSAQLISATAFKQSLASCSVLEHPGTGSHSHSSLWSMALKNTYRIEATVQDQNGQQACHKKVRTTEMGMDVLRAFPLLHGFSWCYKNKSSFSKPSQHINLHLFHIYLWNAKWWSAWLLPHSKEIACFHTLNSSQR